MFFVVVLCLNDTKTIYPHIIYMCKILFKRKKNKTQSNFVFIFITNN
jgi:hypothetical protein